MNDNIPGAVQDAVDQYMEIYKVYKQLEERMQETRKIIEPFMKDNGVDAISDTKQTGRIQLTLQERAKMTSRYTTYDIADLSKAVEPNLVKKCLVEVIDKDKVEALAKLGELPSNVSSYRSTAQSYSLTVRFNK